MFAGPKVAGPSGGWFRCLSLRQQGFSLEITCCFPGEGSLSGVVASTGKAGKTPFTPVLLIYWFFFTSVWKGQCSNAQTNEIWLCLSHIPKLALISLTGSFAWLQCASSYVGTKTPPVHEAQWFTLCILGIQTIWTFTCEGDRKSQRGCSYHALYFRMGSVSACVLGNGISDSLICPKMNRHFWIQIRWKKK